MLHEPNLIGSLGSGLSLFSHLTHITPKHTAFAEFIETHGRQFESAVEAEYRFGIFSETYDTVMTHNANPDRGYEMGINHFADLSEEEHEALMNLNSNLKTPESSPHRLTSWWDPLEWWDKSEDKEIKQPKEAAPSAFPDSFSWKEKGVYTNANID